MSPVAFSIMTLAVVAVGVGWSLIQYQVVPAVAPTKVSIFTKVARRDLYQDAFNENVFMKPGAALTRGFNVIDDNVVDGAVKGLGLVVFEISHGIKKLQNGYVRSYALLMSVGILALLAAVWVVTL